MHAADAAEMARQALAEADDRARTGFGEVSAALVAVADGWTRLAATLAEHPVAASTEAAEIQVHVASTNVTDEDLVKIVRRGLAGISVLNPGRDQGRRPV